MLDDALVDPGHQIGVSPQPEPLQVVPARRCIRKRCVYPEFLRRCRVRDIGVKFAFRRVGTLQIPFEITQRLLVLLLEKMALRGDGKQTCLLGVRFHIWN